MPFDSAPNITSESPEPSDSAENKKRRGRPQAGTRPLGLGLMRDGLLNDTLNEEGRQRLEALVYARENSFLEAAEEFGVSDGSLYRWQNKLKEANGNPISLNGIEREQFNIEEDIQEILATKFPEDLYVSTTTHPEKEIEYTVVDVDAIKQFVQTELRHGGRRVRQEIVASAILERHKDDKKVLTKEQVERGEYNAKSLFYYPESVEGATSNVSIADSKFHLALWELTENGVFHTRESLHPTESGEQLTAFETKAALLLFHPEYGDGRRDKTTKGEPLMIKNPQYDFDKPDSPDNREREPFGRDLLKKYGLLQILQTEDTETVRSIREGMEAELPHLLENQELFLSDIRKVVRDHENQSLEGHDAKRVSPSAYVMYGSVNHYVGRKFAGDFAQPFSDERAIVKREVNGKQVVVAAFNMVSRSDASAEYKGKNKNVIARANGPLTQPKEIKYEKLVPRGQEGLQGALRESKIHELQRLVTDRFTDLVTEANRSEELIDSEARDLSDTQKEELAERVRTLLLQQAEKVIDIAAAATDADSLKDDLETYTFDKRAFTSLVQSLGVEAMLSNPLREVSSEDLTQDQKNRMLELMHKNYETLYPGDEYAEFRTKVEAGLHASFENSSTLFYVLEDNGEIVSFNRFDEIPDSSDRQIKYFGSFNADSTYRGVGSEMLEKTIEAQMQNSEVMFAHCDPKMAISKKYIEDGFVATQTDTIASHFSFEIWRSGSTVENLETKQMSKEDLMTLANISAGPEDDYFVREVEVNDAFDELDSGLPYLLTRYFTHEAKTYVAFEINTSVSKDFMLKNSSEDVAEQKLAA